MDKQPLQEVINLNFILTEDGNWENTEATFGVPGTLFAICIEKVVSRFNRDLPPKYFVVSDGLNNNCYQSQSCQI